MSVDNDLELNLSPIKKPTASRGRRANNSATKQGKLCLLSPKIPLKALPTFDNSSNIKLMQ
jgi:hypothetical protein